MLLFTHFLPGIKWVNLPISGKARFG
jgi:hypothetical protein